ncbi:hypothetical protein [Nonomuraea sp. NPDC050310]|uniref:hypothetical protein n=1 Tax=Nonomuraea sp. NPDC050310 TaxID=3154935 RepID=UPI0033F3F37A
MTADHDRGVGPRGEEEASRGPIPLTPGPAEPAGAETTAPPPPEASPREGATDRLIPYGTYAESPADAYPTAPLGAVPPQRGELRGFLRNRYTQIIGAALTGVAAGVVIGGLADGSDRHRGPVWGHHPGHSEEFPGAFRIEVPDRDVFRVLPPDPDAPQGVPDPAAPEPGD